MSLIELCVTPGRVDARRIACATRRLATRSNATAATSSLSRDSVRTLKLAYLRQYVLVYPQVNWPTWIARSINAFPR